MAGPPSVTEIVAKLQSVGFCSQSDIGNGDESESINSVFHRVLSVFLAEIHPPPVTGSRPVPAMLGDGRPVDLFKLFFAVRDKGGSKSVTDNKAWSSVAVAIGSDPAIASSLKLVYSKYLDALDGWLDRIFVNNEKRNKEEKENQFLTPVNRRREEEPGLLVCNKKRKRDELAGMLSWLLRVAKNPGNPAIGIARLVASGPGEKDRAAHEVEEVYSQVVSVREALFLKEIPNPGGAGLLKGQKISPSIYEDVASEKVRSSKRLHSLSRQSDPSLGSESSTLCDSDMDNNHIDSEAEVDRGKRKLRNSSLLFDIIGLLSKEQKRVPVGTSFQANLPAWTDKGSAVFDDAEDLKWLGTPIWPPENQGGLPIEQVTTIGKGRQDSCMCKYPGPGPGSVECVRFHVAEKRFRLKLDLGSAFHAWQFDRMGEEVALRWTEEEARKFKAIVRLNPLALSKNFWDHLHLSFPLKGRKCLVSYYFNVFLLARRSYQNRLTRNYIDSDDEETEFGFLSKPFGHDAIKIHAPNPIFCVQNAQCLDVND